MKLKIINSQTNEELQEFDLASAIRSDGKCIVGRSATSGLVLESTDISRKHGKFSYKSGKYYFTDTGSSNGSLINNQVATKNRAYLLQAGDVIHLGEFLLIPQPISGVYEDATVIAPIAFAPSSNGAKPIISETPSSPEAIGEITPVDEAPAEEIPAATAELENMEQSDRDDILSEKLSENSSAKVTDVVEASIPPEVVAGTTEMPDANIAESDVAESDIEDILADASLEQPHEDISAIAMDKSTILPESISPEDMAESDTFEGARSEERGVRATSPEDMSESEIAEDIAESDTAEILAAIAEQPESEESNTNTPVAEEIVTEEIVEENVAVVAEDSVPVEVAAASTVGESSEPSTPAASIPTEDLAVEAAFSENTYIQTDVPNYISMESTHAIVPTTNEVTDEELSDRDDISAVPEILKEKSIVLLAHDSQKAELVDFIERHQATFSKCLFMAPAAISEALMQYDIPVSRKLPNLTAGGYQEINSAIASKNLLGVIFLRDFLVPQPTQANDEALSRSCNVNQVILATNLATAQAFEGYLQYLIASTPKVSLAKGSGQ
ncbi:MAG: Methylglyoxal synthase [Chroococcidiopsis sp. SAG 2025]|uniref:FHA domain-containing protein n=1 Tax=Chroococcidiopsis sp. SAG 2025 TaxID=171389 RepID=UPI002936D7BD|nr:FHA domain-containing protein [Chroococcidiopsis sp. SAG 2025]MDV2997169.1 Methylglyoxal synthase [Chroococcidiopsis sp. SAG 2025]